MVVSCGLKSLSFMARRAGPNIVVADACYKCAGAHGHGDRKHTLWHRFTQLSFCRSLCARKSELRVQAASHCECMRTSTEMTPGLTHAHPQKSLSLPS